MAPLKKIAQIGATGSLGSVVLKELVDAGDFEVTILSRAAGKLPAEYASRGVKEVVVDDFSSESAVEQALRGQDAVISTAGLGGLAQQPVWANAAVKAGVKRFLPSDYGCDLDNPLSRPLPVYGDKVKIQDTLKELSRSSDLTYTFVYNNAFLDWGLRVGFYVDVKGRKINFFNGADFPISFTRLVTVAKGVVGVLRHPEETANKSVRIHDGRVTKKEVLAAIQEVTGTEGWEVNQKTASEVVKTSNEALAKGITDVWVFYAYLNVASETEEYGAGYEKVDNELLGLKEHSVEEVKGFIKETVKEIVSSQK